MVMTIYGLQCKKEDMIEQHTVLKYKDATLNSQLRFICLRSEGRY